MIPGNADWTIFLKSDVYSEIRRKLPFSNLPFYDIFVLSLNFVKSDN